MVKAMFCLAFAMSVHAASADGCIISGSTNSVPSSVLASAAGPVNSGNVAAPAVADALEARSVTWWYSLPIGIDPDLIPGIIMIFK